MTFAGAVTRLLTWDPTGISNSYGLDAAFPIAQVDMPCLLLTTAGTGGEGLAPANVDMSDGRLVVHINHLLLLGGLGSVTRLSTISLGDVPTFVDNYMAAVKVDWDLNDTLSEPLRIVATTFGPLDVAGNLYTGVAFRHRWVVRA